MAVLPKDINPLFMARRHGLKTYHVSESWLARPEQSPQEKEIAKLKRQVTEYAKAEPVFDIQLEVPPQPIEVYQVNKLSDEDASALVDEILLANPKPVQRRDPMGLAHAFGGHDSSLDNRFADYARAVVPNFTKKCHKKLEIRFGQIPFNLILENIGNVRADHLCIDVQIVGGWFNSKPIFSGTYPSAPQVKDRQFPMNIMPFRKPHFAVGRHEVEIDETDKSRAVFCPVCRFSPRPKVGVHWSNVA